MSSWAPIGQLDDREPRMVEGDEPQLVDPVEHAATVSRQLGPQVVPLDLVHAETGQDGRQGGRWRRAGVEVGGGRHLEVVLERRGERDEREQRRVRLGEAGDQDQVLVGLVEVPDHAVAASAVGEGV